MKNMGYQPIEDLLPKAGGSVYRLSRMAANRALELSDGKPCLIAKPLSDKVTTMALEEIRSGKVVLKAVADRSPAQEKSSVN